MGKCQVLTISKKYKPVWYDYNLHRIVLEHVTLAKYMGVTIQHGTLISIKSPKVQIDHVDSPGKLP